MISRYFIIFPIGCLGESNVYQNMVDFTSTLYFTCRVSEWFFKVCFFVVKKFCFVIIWAFVQVRIFC